MPFPTLLTRFAKKPSGARRLRSKLRVGIPRILNVWSTHQFWLGFLGALGIEPASIVFSSETSEEQHREFGKGRGTVDCCYPVKCVVGSLRRADLRAAEGHRRPALADDLLAAVFSAGSCRRHARVSARDGGAREHPVRIHEGERSVRGSRHPLRLAARRARASRALPRSSCTRRWKDVLYGLTRRGDGVPPSRKAIERSQRFNQRLRDSARDILTRCAQEDRPCLLVLARPYHMDSGIGHEIDVDLQSCGYPVLWSQYLPHRSRLAGLDVRRRSRGGRHQVAARHLGRVALVLQREHQRAAVGREGRRARAVDHVRDPPGQLRVRHGPADVHARAADRRVVGNAVLLVPGPRRDQAGRRRQDSRRDDRRTTCSSTRRRSSSARRRRPHPPVR